MPIVHALFTVIGFVLLAVTLPLVLELGVLSFAAIFPPRTLSQGNGSSLRLAVVVPAHNEEKLIAACVSSIVASSGPLVTTYVIAHNCTDLTAERAVAAGAQVLRLDESSGAGKGVALHYAFTHAVAAGADAVLVVDADSVVSPELTSRVAAALQAGSPALQCRYMVANSGATARTRLLSLAFLGMNVLRPRGRSRLGLSCGIFGNGFALSAATLERVPYLAHSVVEDLEYHLQLVRAGIRVDFLDDAKVLGEMPSNDAGAGTQRARWEGGRMLMRRQFTGPLLREVLAGRMRFLELLLDLLCVPLATGAVLLALCLLPPLPWLRFTAGCGLGVLLLYVLVAALLGDEPLQDLKALAAAPFYIAFKIAMIPSTRRAALKDAAWVRTKRNDTDVR